MKMKLLALPSLIASLPLCLAIPSYAYTFRGDPNNIASCANPEWMDAHIVRLHNDCNFKVRFDVFLTQKDSCNDTTTPYIVNQGTYTDVRTACQPRESGPINTTRL